MVTTVYERENCVDDIQGGGNSVDDVVKFKNESTEIMKDAGFGLHKWHDNCPGVESTNNQKEYARPLMPKHWLETHQLAKRNFWDYPGTRKPMLWRSTLNHALKLRNQLRNKR